MTKVCKACGGKFTVDGNGGVRCPTCMARYQMVQGVLLTYGEAGVYFGLMLAAAGLLLLGLSTVL